MTEDTIYTGRDDKLVPVTHVRVVFVFYLVNLKFHRDKTSDDLSILF